MKKRAAEVIRKNREEEERKKKEDEEAREAKSKLNAGIRKKNQEVFNKQKAQGIVAVAEQRRNAEKEKELKQRQKENNEIIEIEHVPSLPAPSEDKEQDKEQDKAKDEDKRWWHRFRREDTSQRSS